MTESVVEQAALARSRWCSLGYDLCLITSNAKADFEHLPPEQLADDILQKELRIADIMREIKELLGAKP
jgi:hypothetical protein